MDSITVLPTRTWCGIVTFIISTITLTTGQAPSAYARDPGPEKPLQLLQTQTPKHTYSIAGEVRAFVAKGPKESPGETTVSLASLQTQYGKFDKARVLVLDGEGNPVEVSDVKVSKDGKAAINAVAGYQYLIYPDIPNFWATYDVICITSGLSLPSEISGRICNQILCSDQ